MLLLVLVCLLVAHTKGSNNTSNFFRFGADEGDTILVYLDGGINKDDYDDGLFHIYLNESFPFQDVENNTHFQLSNNGYIAFGNITYDEHDPVDFPRLHRVNPLVAAPQIDVFHTDLVFTYDYRSCFSYQLHLPYGHVYDKVSEDIYEHFDRKKFLPTRIFVATWKYVEHYQLGTRGQLTFQLALATDEIETYLFLNYADFNYTEFQPIAIGWQGQSVLNYFQHPLTQLEEDPFDESVNRPLRMTVDSNVGIPGAWIYRVRKEVIEVELPPPSPTEATFCPPIPSNFCDRREPDKSYTIYYDEDGPTYHHYYVVCTHGHKPRCMQCATHGLTYVQECEECLAYDPNGNYKCRPKITTTPATTQYVPYGGCTRQAVSQYCYDKPSGFYTVALDITDTHYYWCVGKGAYFHYCMSCPAGTKFSITDPVNQLTGLCLIPLVE